MINQPIAVDNVSLEMTAAGTAEVKDGALTEAKMKHGTIQSIESSGFTIDHQGSNVVWLWLNFGMGTPFTSDETTAITDGVRPGHELFIYVRQNNMGSSVILKNGANVNLPGDWKTYMSQTGDWLHLRWDHLVGEWVYIDSNDGMPADCSGANAHGEGNFTIASGDNSHAEGNTTEASGMASHAQGSCTIASGDASHAEGVSGLASHYGEHAQAGSCFSLSGDAQGCRMQILREVTLGADTWYTVYLAKDPSKHMSLTLGDTTAVDVLWGFECRLIGCTQGLGNCFDYNIRGTIKNTAAGMELLYSSPSTYYKDVATISPRAAIDSTNNALLIQVKDTEAAINQHKIRWTGTIRIQQLQWS